MHRQPDCDCLDCYMADRLLTREPMAIVRSAQRHIADRDDRGWFDSFAYGHLLRAEFLLRGFTVHMAENLPQSHPELSEGAL